MVHGLDHVIILRFGFLATDAGASPIETLRRCCVYSDAGVFVADAYGCLAWVIKAS